MLMTAQNESNSTTHNLKLDSILNAVKVLQNIYGINFMSIFLVLNSHKKRDVESEGRMTPVRLCASKKNPSFIIDWLVSCFIRQSDGRTVGH